MKIIKLSVFTVSAVLGLVACSEEGNPVADSGSESLVSTASSSAILFPVESSSSFMFPVDQSSSTVLPVESSSSLVFPGFSIPAFMTSV